MTSPPAIMADRPDRITLQDGIISSISDGGLWKAPLHVFERLPSTNTRLLEHGNACVHGETLRALSQSEGRGRNGRSWFSLSAKSLTFSTAFRRADCALGPEYQGTVAALALARFMERNDVIPRLKWPNDVLVNDLKIAGILAESRSDAPDVVVVGIGCNINQTSADFVAVELERTAVSLAMLTGRHHDLDMVFNDILTIWQRTADEMNRAGLSALATEWQRRDALRGRKIIADIGGRPIRGMALGVNDQLELAIRDDNGATHALRSGEVTHIGPLF